MTYNFYPPITPTPELVKQWCCEDGDEVATSPRWFHIVCTKAARWGADQQLDMDADQINQAWQKGADQELEACCEWLKTIAMTKPWDTVAQLALELRDARRPKPPSLKEQALTQLDSLHADLKTHGLGTNTDTIRRALEQLND